MKKLTIDERLTLLRSKMTDHKVDALIVLSSDAHQSEYVSDYWLARSWISGFTGSAGLAIVTLDHAGVWTDSRYFTQAERELSTSSFVLHKQVNQFEPDHLIWLKENLSANAKIAVDGRTISKQQFEKWQGILSEAKIELSTDHDLVGMIWDDRPQGNVSAIYEHDILYAGKSRANKLSDLRATFDKEGVDQMLIASLDDIAWVLNLRGSDVECNPLFYSYLLVNHASATLFCHTDKVPSAIKQKLQSDGIDIAAYDDIYESMSSLNPDAKLGADLGIVSIQLANLTKASLKHVETPTRLAKAIKNNTEIAHIRNVMVKDGVALAKAFYWLEQNLESRPVSEYEFGKKLEECRSEQPLFVGNSFHAIVAYGPNAAMPHYRAPEINSAMIKAEGILLVDSGGQYLDGTTDITRTFALSKPTPEQKQHFTLVLKGMIGLTKAIFPKGTNGMQLDVYARQHLWAEGLNFGHGTGHGVGFFMNVHEPPQGFSPTTSSRGSTVHVPGMLTSNEPGFYLDGYYGIRIENLLITQESEHQDFLEHETVTLYPIDLHLIDETIMDSREKSWLNNYHNMVYQKISPFLSTEEKEWFRFKCKPLN